MQGASWATSGVTHLSLDVFAGQKVCASGCVRLMQVSLSSYEEERGGIDIGVRRQGGDASDAPDALRGQVMNDDEAMEGRMRAWM